MEHDAESGPHREELTDETPTRVSKTERILNLIAFLRTASTPVPLSTILREVRGFDDGGSRDSLVRRFERDKKVIREMGIPIHYEPPDAFGEEGYSIPREEYYLGAVELPEGGNELLRALAIALKDKKGRLADDMRSAFLKLGFDAAEDFGDDDDLGDGGRPPLEGSFDLKLDASPAVNTNMELITEAVALRRRVTITYYTIARDTVTTRQVDPWGFGFGGQAWSRGAWYLVGWCHLRRAQRVFKVHRIRGDVRFQGAETPPDFHGPPQGFSVADHVGRPRWEYSGLAKALRGGGDEAPTEARIRVDRAVLAPVQELVPGAPVETEDDQGAILKLTIRHRRPLLRFLLRHLGHAELLEPPELRAELADLARAVRSRLDPDAERAAS